MNFTTTQWRDAVSGAANEIAKVALGFPGAQVADPTPLEEGNAMVGAHIPMVGKSSYELSLVSSRAGCSDIATAVLGMDVNDLPSSAVRDAIGEIVNMLAGGVKRRLASSGGDLELGLPVFMNGSIEPAGSQSALALPLKLGPIAALVIIVGPK